MNMIQETFLSMDIKAKAKGLSLTLSIEPELDKNYISDPFRLRQIFVNFIGNAVKFTEKGRVKLKVTSSGEKSERKRLLQFAVSDTGIGMSKEALDKILEPFTQADESTARRFGGSGLGTAISKQLVELMGGQIWVESELGKGSTFYFTIPMTVTTEKVEIIIPDDFTLLKSLRRFRVLLAEDIEENITLAKIRLEQQGHEVVIARNGRQAIETFQRDSIDVILMDIQMPEMDGLEATRIIREAQTESESHIPVIAMTAGIMKEDREKCRQAGMDAIVGKPIDFGELFATMEDVVPEGFGQPVPENEQTAKEMHKMSQMKMIQSDLPALDGIDIKKGIQLWQDSDVYLSALVDFSRKYGDVSDELARSIENNDLKKVQSIAHALKGLAGNLSVTEVFSISEKLNDAANRQHIGAVNELVPLLQEALGIALQSIEQIETEFIRSKDKEVKELDPVLVKEILMNLIDSYKLYDPDETAPYLKELSDFFSDEDLAPINKMLGDFNFDGARDETIKFSKNLNIDLEIDEKC
jgi:signal transduction histidine kinase/DNA-binding NarL/FixJ family response regulator